MKILLVEDDENKRKSILAFLNRTRPDSQVELALSYRSAVEAIISKQWDFLLLDMALPTFDLSDVEDGYQTEAFAGATVLREMKRKGKSIPTVIITQFETLGEGAERRSLAELEKILATEYPGRYLGTIFYAPGENSWMPKLTEFLNKYDKDTSN